MNSSLVTVLDCRAFERPYRLRIPFRFGVKTATEGRQLILRLRIRTSDGREDYGYSAEALGAKWFDKDLALTDEQNYHQLRRSVELASSAYLSTGQSTAFGLFAELHGTHEKACANEKLNPLIASFGQSMIDRAIMDALCRIQGTGFFEAMASNLFGLCAHPVIEDLSELDLAQMFASRKHPETIHIRHTVGLADPLTSDDIASADRVNDGLPETLEEVIAFYGNRYFKLKISGDEKADLARLEKIAGVLDKSGQPYHVTLDGNERYPNAEAFRAFLEAIRANPALERLMDSTLYVEQPIDRANALAETVVALDANLPVIIDESDGSLSAFPQARRLGYRGVSTKVCKGVYKSLINHARCAAWNAAEGTQTYFMSAEDLTCEPGTALHQDLSLVCVLGLGHVEKNAHHFIDGFESRPESEASAFLDAHPDMYHRQDGRVRLNISDGILAVGSLVRAGFGTDRVPVVEALEESPRADWRP